MASASDGASDGASDSASAMDGGRDGATGVGGDVIPPFEAPATVRGLAQATRVCATATACSSTARQNALRPSETPVRGWRK